MEISQLVSQHNNFETFLFYKTSSHIHDLSSRLCYDLSRLIEVVDSRDQIVGESCSIGKWTIVESW